MGTPTQPVNCKSRKYRHGFHFVISKPAITAYARSGRRKYTFAVPVAEWASPEAMKCLAADFEEVLTAPHFPGSDRKRIRTTNLLERLFGEGKHQSRVIPRFVNEKAGLSLMFAVLVDASTGCRGVKVTAAVSRELDGLRKDSGSNRAFQEAA